MPDTRRCIGSKRFGIEPHETSIEDFPKQPSQKDEATRHRGCPQPADLRAPAAHECMHVGYVASLKLDDRVVPRAYIRSGPISTTLRP